MKSFYENTCLGCDLLHSKVCPHYPKNQYPGHYKNISSPLIAKTQLYSHQYVELRNGMYEGTMSNFKRESLGIFYSDEGFLCVGNWLQDYLEGKSIIFFLNGGYLYVNFANNKINGLGVLKLKNSSLIAGVWKENNLEGISFHHYPDKCLWIQCEYRDGELIRYIKEERYGPGVDSLNYMKEDYVPEIKLPEMLNSYPDIKNLILSVYTKNFVKNIIKEMKINVRGKFSEFKMISLLVINKDLNYLGFSENNKPNGLGIIYDDRLNISSCGYFKGGYLDGIGRINYDNGDVYEGVIRKKEFQVGVYFTCEANIFEFGIFKDNVCNRAYQKGEGFPSELLKKFKSILHKKHIKFSDKFFNLTQNAKNTGFNILSNVSFEEPERDDVKFSNEKLKKIELHPASFLEEERLFHKNLAQNSKFYENRKENDFYSPIIQLSETKKKNPLSKQFEKTTKSSQKIKFKEEPELFPLNISQYPLKEDRNWLKYTKENYDFYDKNIETYTVESQNNYINDSIHRPSNLKTHTNEEIVNLSHKNTKTHKKNPSTFVTYHYEEQNNDPYKKTFIKEENPNEKPFNNDESFSKKTLTKEEIPLNRPSNKRSISLAPPLKKDSTTSDDLREIFESAYMISLESDKEFQSLPRFYENRNNEKNPDENKNHEKNLSHKKPYPLYKNLEENQRFNQSKSLAENNKIEKRNYLIYSINDPQHLENKNDHLIDCIVYDFDKDKLRKELDLAKKNRKKIFDPM